MALSTGDIYANMHLIQNLFKFLIFLVKPLVSSDLDLGRLSVALAHKTGMNRSSAPIIRTGLMTKRLDSSANTPIHSKYLRLTGVFLSATGLVKNIRKKL